MFDILVETNWVFACAAPAHHRDPVAYRLLERCRQGELRLHLPAFCLTEVRRPIRTKHQPRDAADELRAYLSWALAASRVSPEQEQATLALLDRYESDVNLGLARLDATLAALREDPSLDVFALDDSMLGKACELGLLELGLKPFDHAALAAVLVRASQLRAAGAGRVVFCNEDFDLLPWSRQGTSKPELARLYNEARIEVHRGFDAP